MRLATASGPPKPGELVEEPVGELGEDIGKAAWSEAAKSLQTASGVGSELSGTIGLVAAGDFGGGDIDEGEPSSLSATARQMSVVGW